MLDLLTPSSTLQLTILGSSSPLILGGEDGSESPVPSQSQAFSLACGEVGAREGTQQIGLNQEKIR